MAQTQTALYHELAEGGLQLSWSEAELPERERTKHVHRLHPYLGKFVPQLVEALLGRYVRPGGRVLDPFAGSGTTLVQSLESGYDAVGIDVAAFNCLLMRVKTAQYDVVHLEKELREVVSRIGSSGERANGYLGEWYSPRAAAELLHFRSLLGDYEHADVLRVVLARAARSARLTRHDDLEFPKAPQRDPYPCYKHRRTCRPVDEAGKFLTRYLLDTLGRLKSFHRVRHQARLAAVVHGDAREAALVGRFDGIVTSPPYPGLIDYHEQHRYAYELLRLDDRRERELGAAARGTSRAAVAEYADGISEILRRCSDALVPGAPVLIVVNDRRGLYPEILERSGLEIADRLERHVNRRTGRRAGEYFESVLVATKGAR
jgi:DNA modification methylase